MSKILMVTCCCVLLALNSLNAQASAWQPAPGHTQMSIWPGVVPDAQTITKPEETKTVDDPLAAGKSWVQVSRDLQI